MAMGQEDTGLLRSKDWNAWKWSMLRIEKNSNADVVTSQDAYLLPLLPPRFNVSSLLLAR